MAQVDYTIDRTAAAQDAWAFPAQVSDPVLYSSEWAARITAKYFGKPVLDELLALIYSRVASKTYSKLWTCLAGLNVGDPVYISATDTATLALATTEPTSRVVGFVRSKPSTITCYIEHYLLKTGLSGLTAGNPVYLTDAGGFGAAAGTVSKTIGYAIDTDEALLSASPSPGGTGDHGALSGLADDDHTQYLLAAGTRALSAAWDAGSWQIRAETFQSDVATGTPPLTVASATVVTNLNADTVDGSHASAFATSAHLHDGQTIECDGIDSSAASFSLDVDGALALNPNATGDVNLFGSAASGETPYFTIGGFRAADSLRLWKFGVGVDAANSVSQYLGTTRIAYADATLHSLGFGAESLAATPSGVRNTAYGDRALQRVSTGERNFGFGYEAAAYITSGSSNVSIGSQSMGYGVGGHGNNMVIGTLAMYGITDGNQLECSDNVAIGSNVLQHAYYVRRNVAIGTQAMLGKGATSALGVIGEYNIAIGYQSMTNLGGDGYADRNVCIGGLTAATLTGGDNNVLIGHGMDVSSGTESNTLKIGSTSANAIPILKGDMANNYLYLISDSHRLYFGADNDVYETFNGTQWDFVGSANMRFFPTATSGQTPTLQISGYPTGQSLQAVTMGMKAATDGVFLFSAATDVTQFAFDTSVDVTGNITVSGTVDGRDLAADGIKLDGIGGFREALLARSMIV